MTCIVAVEHDGKVYMGGDSAGSNGYSIAIMTEPKVFRRGKFLIGYTTSFRMGQLLQHTLKPPALTAEWADNIPGFMVAKFIPAVRKCLSDGGYLKKSDEVIKGGTFLVGFKGELYVVESDMQVGRVADGYYAVGSGSDLALGSMYTSGHFGNRRPPKARLLDALHSAAHHACGVAGPFTILDDA